jgi:hypothetical protein
MPLCENIYKDGGLLTEASYKDVKSTALDAGKSTSFDRCGEFDDAYYAGYRDQYYYYYYGDDADDDTVDDDDTAAISSSSGGDSSTPGTGAVLVDDYDDDDDDDDGDDDYENKYSSFHLGFRNELKDIIEANKKKEKSSIPIAAYASVLAVSVLLVSVVVIYLRWHKAKAMLVMASRAHSGTTKFSRLSAHEQDEEGSFRNMLREEESSYGSL